MSERPSLGAAAWLNGQDPAAVDRAAHLLAGGALLAFATETVYGLGARADSDAAVAQIFQLKGRPADHPLIVHVADAVQAQVFAEATPLARRLMAAAWPGPVSIVLRRRAGVAGAAAGGLPTVALRCPSHPVAQALLQRCHALGVPGVAAPSANRFGRVSPTTAAHVIEEFGARVPVLDGGPCESGIESAIIDCSGERPQLLRPGSLPRADLAQLLGQSQLDLADDHAPRVSGSLESHYAPDAPLQLLTAAEIPDWTQLQCARHGANRVALWSIEAPERQDLHWQPMPTDATLAAQRLFAVLRAWDAAGVRIIGVQAPPALAAWEGVRDRLQRASAPRRDIAQAASA